METVTVAAMMMAVARARGGGGARRGRGMEKNTNNGNINFISCSNTRHNNNSNNDSRNNRSTDNNNNKQTSCKPHASFQSDLWPSLWSRNQDLIQKIKDQNKSAISDLQSAETNQTNTYLPHQWQKQYQQPQNLTQKFDYPKIWWPWNSTLKSEGQRRASSDTYDFFRWATAQFTGHIEKIRFI